MKHDVSRRAEKNEAPPLDWFQVRGFFVSRGFSAAEWARSRGYVPAYVNLSANGHRRGPKARRIVAELKEELGL